MPHALPPPPSDAGRSSRPIRWIIVSGLIGILLICAIGTFAALRLRAHEIAQAERNLKTLDLLLGEETERAIQSADLIVRSFQEKIAKDGVKTSADLEATQANPETFMLLRSRIAGVPQIAAVSVVGETGTVIVSSRSFPAPNFSVASRDFFQQLKGSQPDALILSPPLQNYVDGGWTSYVARRINGSAGQFLGIVTAAVDLAYFDDLYKALDVGNGGAVSLWSRNGLLMARFPPLPNGIGRRFPIRSFSGILRTEPTTYTEMAAIDGKARIVSTIAAKQFPLVINVTATLDQILQDWRQTASLIVFGCLFCIAAVVVVLWLLARQVRTYAALDIAHAARIEAVAARDHAEDQLRQAQKLEAIGQLTGGVAHDFNNLLTAVLGNLELLQRHGRDQGERFQRWTQNALDAAQRGATLTQRLLAFSRRQPLNPTATDVAQLIRSMTDLLARTLGENIRLDAKLEPDLRHADVDANQLDNAILNIAINARDAMEGHGTLTISARNVTLDQAFCRRAPGLASGDFVLIAIGDTGTGIPPAVLEQVFEPFFTTKPIGQGTGLGLSQVHGFVHQTGGHIAIESTMQVGTRVDIYLPCAKCEAVPAAPPAEVPADREMPFRGLRVLVVEDDGVVRAYSVELLRELGFEVVAMADAKQALDAFHDGQPFDLLFTDVGLPGQNGHELALDAQRRQPGLKVIFASGYTRDVLMHQGRLDHGVHLLPKPFTRVQLTLKLRQVLTPEVLGAAVD